MFEINKNLIQNVEWRKLNNNSADPIAPSAIDINCPSVECQRSFVNIKLNWRAVDQSFLYTQVVCGKCRASAWLLLFNAPQNKDSIEQCQLFIHPSPVTIPSIKPEIRDFSPNFIKIYTQTITAESLGLDELNGIGYRKSLEFLIKDYLCYKHPDKDQEIRKSFLTNCIKDYISDPNIKDCAERTAWLGNDETHYERRWKDKDIDDLKILLQLTLYWISSEFLTEKYKLDMGKS